MGMSSEQQHLDALCASLYSFAFTQRCELALEACTCEWQTELE